LTPALRRRPRTYPTCACGKLPFEPQGECAQKQIPLSPRLNSVQGYLPGEVEHPRTLLGQGESETFFEFPQTTFETSSPGGGGGEKERSNCLVHKCGGPPVDPDGGDAAEGPSDPRNTSARSGPGTPPRRRPSVLTCPVLICPVELPPPPREGPTDLKKNPGPLLRRGCHIRRRPRHLKGDKM